MADSIKEVAPEVVLDKLTKEENILIVDVREHDEWDAGHIAEAILIPLGSVPYSLEQFDTSKEIYIVCRSGVRSYHACEFLQQNGIEAANMIGGMLAWPGDIAR
ncbi:rhodanese-like domain-containing protein [Brevibacillus daliensis]|uniref:rhodanese-like domain-containing protein n=1 Tax=Brevibacillus daliensis TaxID=2892995 RepID=UPI001E39092E|nr:rhodanese-like domain-containing protein [Brevibacillus daliensis]